MPAGPNVPSSPGDDRPEEVGASAVRVLVAAERESRGVVVAVLIALPELDERFGKRCAGGVVDDSAEVEPHPADGRGDQIAACGGVGLEQRALDGRRSLLSRAGRGDGEREGRAACRRGPGRLRRLGRGAGRGSHARPEGHRGHARGRGPDERPPRTSPLAVRPCRGQGPVAAPGLISSAYRIASPCRKELVDGAPDGTGRQGGTAGGLRQWGDD